MWELVFGIMTLCFGVYALVKGRLQLSKIYILEGNPAKIAGLLLVAAPIIGGILERNNQLEMGVFNLSFDAIFIVVVYTVLQSRAADRMQQGKIKMAPLQPEAPSDSGKQAAADSSVNEQPVKEIASLKENPKPQRSGIITCPNCGTRVLPKSDGTCPNCKAKITA